MRTPFHDSRMFKYMAMLIGVCLQLYCERAYNDVAYVTSD
jgi:hypothetical protein